ncbi:MAG TPA: bifunctional demethylmenaquinone methyltransferase/2-methoxy-6-polyprenyl-1,4-benzoquinol methylase UbiE [Thiotrichales bacterium]|nr:MAG: bifunctional demethylmenaquinone methyltransferase/2-methoxy-6-polyprenyl-1,4-benzoquinol methylase [Thiotrichales bacterium 35-46-9]OZA75391.1 MAG: bifunctional demethylmenaquinone methyltransferase/2-methoxy-6-polyprenyl-1,4-benzoquinol methylase [Thiotrichales bacterium 39-47-5]UCG18597.1 MAG: bifunctional demethylmenaquinone methyltransferase/2-methoxy-6-polyprenyl-1,4-benzoquinol methylase UbiE [Thiotrichales bacterium]HQR81801.1 bifunctional demethylmenaquinone methyltransferase/2-
MAKIDFGFQQVDWTEKAQRVKGVFDSVAPKYDLMNDLMSMGIHRLWKRHAIDTLGLLPHHQVLDLASGTGDLALRIAPLLNDQGKITLSDINESMLNIGKQRMIDAGHLRAEYAVANAESLPFADNSFDRITMAFGLRNVTDKQQALNELHRVLKPNGLLMVVEFSKVIDPLLAKGYDFYSFNVLPHLGQLVANDRDSYQYLAESIRMHPDQETLADMFRQAGLIKVSYENLTAGVVAIHKGWKTAS